MSPLSAVDYEEYDVVETCRRAASRLRSQPRRVASESAQLELLVGDLLDAVATALAMRKASVPEGVQRAALRAAQFVRARHKGGAWGGRNGVSQEAVGGQDVPFTPSIQLGRMG